MNFKLPALVALALSCAACVDNNYNLGGSLVPVDQTYSVFCKSLPIEDIYAQMADSLSGYSSTRITVGAIRDEAYGLTTRSSVVSLVPINDTLDFGVNPKVKRLHFAAALDSLSVADETNEHILQNVYVYPLERPLDAAKDFNCNADVPHGTGTITKGIPIINGKDSLSFDFTKEYAEKFLSITQDDMTDLDKYLAKVPGFYIETSKPTGNGGRINMFELQLGFSSDSGISGNYAQLDFEATYDGVKKDTTFYFYYSPKGMITADSLFNNYSAGKYPQYALNLTGHQSRSKAGKISGERVMIEGGGGLKPVIKASTLKAMAEEMIASEGAEPGGVVINKASLILPFDFPEDYKEMDRFPHFLSPTCRLKNDTTAAFMGLTDASSSDENQGDIDRSNLQFAPDITYHLQELLKIKDGDEEKLKRLKGGDYDIWLLIMANETITTSNESSNDMSEYYRMLAYQSYYNSMYGGYGGYGYGGYGYGGYGGYGYGDPYSNYMTYQMMAMYASGSGTSTSTEYQLDKDRYYRGWVNGPANTDRVPRLELTFSVPNKAE